MAAKKLSVLNETGKTVYAMVRRAADSYFLNDADGSFAAAPADPYLSLSENATLKALYEVSESRTVWDDGEYLAVYYAQLGGSPAPVTDEPLGSGVLFIVADAELTSDSVSDALQTVEVLVSRVSAAVKAFSKELVSALDPDLQKIRIAVLDLQQSLLRGRK